MTLDQWYQTNKGQSLLVGTTDDSLRGQCFIMFDSVLHDVYGLPYLNAPGAINIWENNGSYDLSQYFDFIPYNPAMPIKEGDFVVYGAGVGSPFGHVDVAAQDGVGNNYLGYDSNWGHNLTVHQVNHNDSYNQYILGILRNKSNNGGTMQPYTFNETNFYMAFRLLFDREPTAAEASNQSYRDPNTLVTTAWNNGGQTRYYATHNADGSAKPTNGTILVPGTYIVQ